MNGKNLKKIDPIRQKKITDASNKVVFDIMQGFNPQSDHREITVVQTPKSKLGYVQILIKCYVDDPEFLVANKYLN